MIQKGKTMIQNSRLEDKESLLNRDFIEKRKEDFLLTLFLCLYQKIITKVHLHQFYNYYLCKKYLHLNNKFH